MTIAAYLPWAQRLDEDAEGCWLYTGPLNNQGYGHVGYNGRQEYVHRATYMALVGPIPEGLQIDHLCRKRACANPEHLEPVTQHENLLRGYWGARTHCKNGHELTDDNVRLVGKHRTERKCRACERDRGRRQRAGNGPCEIPECAGRAISRGLCNAHYLKWNRARKTAAQ